ncbi:molybdopterin synthase catalytic subunit [Aporhodopirellula aestuarii]|uniref:Molybdopterin synthase catalytic subunit n=1 Tax=Aporhodopirellula aestuarii TaxID=2950107 RepID=A0ABT0U899_9BACT|nr:molybdenum cofactor biosynthesis protein MoaE [Aporhodopirellula aestuarii]MCM2373182.1 molybdenum cofactor biosynthesis protein MoaE [Aporhodopirellula aestuarii]
MENASREANVRVRLTSGPIASATPFVLSDSETALAGAVVTFQGRVRNREVDENEMKPILGLEYEVYEPMTSQELHRLADQYARKHDVIAVDVEHSFGFVGNGECSFLLQVATSHRRSAITFVDEFIDAMKSHVPIWKVPRWSMPDSTA